MLAFEPAAGALELCARLGPKLKLALERVFAQCVLGVDPGPFAPPRQFELNVLKSHRGPLPIDPVDGIAVEVKQLRLSARTGNRQIVLKADPEKAADIFAMLHEVLDRENLPLSAVSVTLATFAFAFFRADGRRAGSATFDVAVPHHIGLRNQRPDRVEVVMRYLTRWGIYVGRGPAPGVAAAG